MQIALSIGQQAIQRKIFTKFELKQYFQLVKNNSSLKESPIVPKALVAGIFSALLGTELPGQGTIYLKQTLNFLADAEIEDELTAKVEVVNIRYDKGLITCKTICTNSKNTTICEGEALVMNKEKVL